MAGHWYHTAGDQHCNLVISEDGGTDFHLANAAGIAGLAQPRFGIHPVSNGAVDMTGFLDVRPWRSEGVNGFRRRKDPVHSNAAGTLL